MVKCEVILNRTGRDGSVKSEVVKYQGTKRINMTLEVEPLVGDRIGVGCPALPYSEESWGEYEIVGRRFELTALPDGESWKTRLILTANKLG